MLGKRIRENDDGDDADNPVVVSSRPSEPAAIESSASINTLDSKSNRSSSMLDFLIVGVQKGGTVAAVKNLNKHPDVFVCPETHFFDLHWDRGIEWYRQKLRSTKAVIGEKTPELIYIDICATRIKEISPTAKFILFLRDPVKRAFSGWNMQRLKGIEDLSFSDAVNREMTTMMGERRVSGTAEYHYLQRGLYMDQIQRFLKVFPDRWAKERHHDLPGISMDQYRYLF